MTTNQILRAYSTKEVSRKIKIPTGTLRKWEKELQGLLDIPRSKQGARIYTENEIFILEKVKEMRSKNIDMDMIRTLLEKHAHEDPIEATEPINLCDNETSELIQPSVIEATEKPILPTETDLSLKHTPNIDDLYAAIEIYKRHMLDEIKSAIQINKSEIIEEVKSEISKGTIQTVHGFSKSIQRANEKRKKEIQSLTHVISQISEQASESVEALSENITEAVNVSYEKIEKQITETSKSESKDYQILMNKVTADIKEAQNDIKNVSKSLQDDQNYFVGTMNENLKELTQVIREREGAFHDMVSSFREAAATKKEKKWWQVWS